MLYILLISITVKNETVLLIYTREKKNEKWTGAFNDPKYYKRFLLAHVNYIKP